MQKLTLLCLLLLPGMLTAQAGDRQKCWVFFTDKGEVNLSEAPTWLSERSLERRQRQGLQPDERDAPLHREYVQAISALQVPMGQPSKWLNATAAWLSPAEQQLVRALPFVSRVQPISPVRLDYEIISPATKTDYDPGYTADQVQMLGLELLHQNGFNGEGILISVMDNGFYNVNQNAAFRHLFDNNRIVATRDFVNNETDVFDQGLHGAWVLSILTGFYPDQFTGAAPGASFILCHTENDASETHQEEDNWVAAMEYADSIGADVFSTSLGYMAMDDTLTSYSYSQLDGDQTIITIAADIAASRGIVVLNSAGNNGANKLNAPADGDSVIAVGAVDAFETLAAFSSLGPSADGRIKPDLCAMGSGTSFVTQDGLISSGGGTSFSCPVLAGFAACLLQSKPSTGNMELYDAMIRSADRFANPDTSYGYGIPQATIAYQILNGSELPRVPDVLLEDYAVVPNPTQGEMWLHTGQLDYQFVAEINIYNLLGERLYTLTTTLYPFYVQSKVQIPVEPGSLAPGMYLVEVMDAESNLNKARDRRLFGGRVVVLR